MIDNKIEMLSDKEHVLKRPGMYIGSVSFEDHERFLFGEFTKVRYVAGVLKLVDEIIDNSVDEAIRTNFKFANKISVSIDLSSNKVTVEDNGRGIPQALVVTPEGEEIPGPVAAWTKTKAGGNFGDDSERVTGGQNGVGSSLTNIFSVMFTGTTSDGKSELIVNCSNNAENVSWKSKPSKTNGTKVEFVPDFSHFEMNQFEKIYQDITIDRLQTLAVIYPDIEFKFNGKKIQGSFKKYAKQFDEECIIQEQDNCSISIGRSPDGFRQLTYVNNIHTKNGGHHVECVMDDICDELIPQIKRKFKIEVTKARIKECLTMLMFVRSMKNMRFDSQTKERLTSPYGEIRSHIQLDSKKLAKSILANEAVLMPIIEAALARKLAAEKAAETKAAKKALKAKVHKHIKANMYGKDADTTLFLTEGDSAMGPFIEVRNKDLQGGYPLRGKVMNTWGMTAADIMKNKELFDICAITGLVIGEPADKTNYRNIAIMTDADVDGTGSIYPSLLAFFSQWPELFEQGRIRFCKTPVIIAQVGKEQEWFYDVPSYTKAKDSLPKHSIRYIKGLGSLEKAEYRRMIQDPKFDVVQLPEDWKDQFEMLLGNDPQLRKAWMS
ncbi:topoisomerase II large subunit [Enterobacteria phage vB_EcoM_IME281]|uniref:DNA topoisomerase (ATP-hydrolyzing) n=1 Tax=Enterobacteria phage vB_EcoM_IME281 TaxID=2163887 RepID=A0A2S1GPG8_9CAUD|nr:DNA topoisomerase II large subunit [Enterobacteria phage vB_EcoM_IME281]AWD91285.1 topoisomerase II large subunit [Enterobacteria phage vB_EcoM_IME281]QAY00031.1 topoisomerase II, large subunit, N-terminal region [Escherichia phage EcWhh-1]